MWVRALSLAPPAPPMFQAQYSVPLALNECPLQELPSGRLGICPGKGNCSHPRPENSVEFIATQHVPVFTSFASLQSTIRQGTMIGVAHWHGKKLRRREGRDGHGVTQLVFGLPGVLPSLHPCQTLLSITGFSPAKRLGTRLLPNTGCPDDTANQ